MGARRLVSALALGIIAHAPLCADEQPLWELGVGVAPLSFPAYRGSRDRQNYVLPLPYVVYRGEVLKADRRGVRGLLVDTDRIELNVSVRGALPVDSDESDARRGMPDLDPTLQIGPSLEFLLAEDQQRRLRLKLPLRGVIATDFNDFETAGFLFHPHLDFTAPKALAGWNLGINVGPIFATRDNHEYYYEVAPQFATADRPRFSPSGGYSGTAAIAGVSRRFDRFWAGAFLRYDNLSGAAFEDSPLAETDHALSTGFAIAWIFAQSKKMVPTREP